MSVAVLGRPRQRPPRTVLNDVEVLENYADWETAQRKHATEVLLGRLDDHSAELRRQLQTVVDEQVRAVDGLCELRRTLRARARENAETLENISMMEAAIRRRVVDDTQQLRCEEEEADVVVLFDAGRDRSGDANEVGGRLAPSSSGTLTTMDPSPTRRVRDDSLKELEGCIWQREAATNALGLARRLEAVVSRALAGRAPDDAAGEAGEGDGGSVKTAATDRGRRQGRGGDDDEMKVDEVKADEEEEEALEGDQQQQRQQQPQQQASPQSLDSSPTGERARSDEEGVFLPFDAAPGDHCHDRREARLAACPEVEAAASELRRLAGLPDEDDNGRNGTGGSSTNATMKALASSQRSPITTATTVAAAAAVRGLQPEFLGQLLYPFEREHREATDLVRRLGRATAAKVRVWSALERTLVRLGRLTERLDEIRCYEAVFADAAPSPLLTARATAAAAAAGASGVLLPPASPLLAGRVGPDHVGPLFEVKL